MNIIPLKVLRNIALLQPCPTKDLLSYIEQTAMDPILALGNLVYDSNIRDKPYIIIKTYINTVLNSFYFIYPLYTSIERQWINFYILLKASGIHLEKAQEIYIDYKSLPELFSSKETMRFIQQEIKNHMFSYYTYLTLDLEELL